MICPYAYHMIDFISQEDTIVFYGQKRNKKGNSKKNRPEEEEKIAN